MDRGCITTCRSHARAVDVLGVDYASLAVPIASGVLARSPHLVLGDPGGRDRSGSRGTHQHGGAPKAAQPLEVVVKHSIFHGEGDGCCFDGVVECGVHEEGLLTGSSRDDALIPRVLPISSKQTFQRWRSDLGGMSFCSEQILPTLGRQKTVGCCGHRFLRRKTYLVNRSLLAAEMTQAVSYIYIYILRIWYDSTRNARPAVVVDSRSVGFH